MLVLQQERIQKERMQVTTERQGKRKRKRKLWGQQRKVKLQEKWHKKIKTKQNEPLAAFLGSSQDLLDM